MELGDIVYFLLMLVFIVFGIFNDSKKKKKTIDKSTPPLNPETDKDIREVFREVFQNREKQQTPPPAPETVNRKKQLPKPVLSTARQSDRWEFQSSLDLVTNFEGESSLKGSMFSSGLFENQQEMKQTEVLHPILEQLRGESRQSEIRKAVIYSEILKKKY